MIEKILLFVIVTCFASCATADQEKAQDIIDETMAASGIEYLERAEVAFDFRNRKYTAKFNNGRFEYARQFENESKRYRDVLNNDGFYREVNGVKVEVSDSMAVKYSSSVNAVIYFALLPRGLNDKAVNKTYLGTKSINGRSYHKIKITFDQKGGGEDFQDEFIYWVGTEDYLIGFLAYSFHTEGGGMRFRTAFNERYIQDIRFVDYVNYKPSTEVLLENIDEAFINDQLNQISIIALENVVVEKFQ